MFDLETTIKNWRRQTEAKWTGDKSTLDELEDHLREEVAVLSRAGRSEQDAWTAAIAKLGNPAAIRREFDKIERLPAFDRWTFTVLLSTLAALTVVAFAAMFVMHGQPIRAIRDQPVLSIHVLAITLGYLTGLIAALIASYGSMRSYFSHTPIPALTGFTLRLVRIASIAAAALTLLGFALGAVWANDAWGRPFNMDPREIGAIVVAASFLVAAIATRQNVMPARVSLAIAIAAG